MSNCSWIDIFLKVLLHFCVIKNDYLMVSLNSTLIYFFKATMEQVIVAPFFSLSDKHTGRTWSWSTCHSSLGSKTGCTYRGVAHGALTLKSSHAIKEWQVPEWVKDPPASAGEAGSIPGSGRPHGVGNSNPLQYSSLENSMDRGAWQATVHGVAESDTRTYKNKGMPDVPQVGGDISESHTLVPFDNTTNDTTTTNEGWQ